jgi:hypothetical protein
MSAGRSASPSGPSATSTSWRRCRSANATQEVTAGELVAAVRADDGDPLGHECVDERRQQLQGGVIGPLEIIKYDGQRVFHHIGGKQLAEQGERSGRPRRRGAALHRGLAGVGRRQQRRLAHAGLAADEQRGRSDGRPPTGEPGVDENELRVAPDEWLSHRTAITTISTAIRK